MPKGLSYTPVLLLILGAKLLGESLVPLNGPCRFTVASEPLDDGWYQLSFDDSTWASGPVSFSSSVSAPVSIPTLGSTHQYLYVRAVFEVEQPEEVGRLFLRADWTGGFVCYLNGFEILNVDTSRQVSDMLPECEGGPRLFDLSTHAVHLKEGKNLFAIKWLVAGEAVPRFSAELLANCTSGPFLHAARPGEQTIVWQTAEPSETLVRYGYIPNQLDLVYYEPTLKIRHVARLTGLLEGATCFYRIAWSNGIPPRFGRLNKFTVLANTGDIKFAALADVGSGSAPQFQLARILDLLGPDLVLFPGDLVYPYFTTQWLHFRFLSVYATLFERVPFFPVAGNHDVLYGASGFFEAFETPTNNVAPEVHLQQHTSSKHFYSFDAGPCHFVGLYAPLGNAPGHLSLGSLQWLDEDLGSTHKPWKVVFMHHPVFSSGLHGQDDYDLDSVPDTDEAAQRLLPILWRHGVQLLITAHDHNYERFCMTNGIQVFVSGGGGGVLYSLAEPHPLSAAFARRHHLLWVQANDQELIVQAVDPNGVVFDEVILRQTCPTAAKPLSSPWGAMWIDPDSQSLCPICGPVPGSSVLRGVMGKSALPGSIRISTDDQCVFVAVENCCLGPSDIGILLLDFADEPSFTNSKPFKSLLSKTLYEGPIALRGLDHVSVRSASPDIAVVFGRAEANKTASDFLCPVFVKFADSPPQLLELPVGQGIFSLFGLSPLPNAGLIQMPHPLASQTKLTQSASAHLLVRIPWEDLGAHRPRYMSVGMVVLRPFIMAVDENTLRWELDTAYVGQRLDGTGTTNVTLWPIWFALPSERDYDNDGLPDEYEQRVGLLPESQDSDSDGLPDGWEIEHGLNPLDPTGMSGPAGDPDGDGLTNLAELILGTDPLDPSSTLQLSTGFDGQTIQLQWINPPSVAARLQWSHSITGPWLDIFSRSQPGQLVRLALPFCSKNNTCGFFRLYFSEPFKSSPVP